MRYIINRKKFEKKLIEQGFSSLSDFARKTAIHRNTLNAYLSGEKSVFGHVMEKICLALQVDPLKLIETQVGKNHRGYSIDELKHNLKPVLQQYENIAFILFGSRARGNAKRYSDWDLGMTGGRKPITSLLYLEVKEAIAIVSDNFPYGVDVVNLDGAPLSFLGEIDYEVSLVGGNKDSYLYFLGMIDGVKRQIKKSSAA